MFAQGGGQGSIFNAHPVQVSQNVSALTALTALTFCFGYQLYDLPFDWLGHIKQLQFLQLSTSHLDMHLPGSFSNLEKLTDMHISTRGHIQLDFQWAGLTSLQATLVMGHFSCGQQLEDLAALSSLDVSEFRTTDAYDLSTKDQLSQLSSRLSVNGTLLAFDGFCMVWKKR